MREELCRVHQSCLGAEASCARRHRCRPRHRRSRHRPPQRRSGRHAPPAATSTTSCRSSSFRTHRPDRRRLLERSITAAENDGALYLVMQFNSGGSVLTRQRFGSSRPACSTPKSRSPSGGSQRCQGKGRRGATGAVGRHGRPSRRVAGRGASAEPLDKSAFRHRSPTRPWRGCANDTIGVRRLRAHRRVIRSDHRAVPDRVPVFRTEIDTSGDQPTIKPLTPWFLGAALLSNQLHTVASPPVAYLLFLIGLGLLIFEFYTAGVGIAGVVGAGSFVLGCYGLDVLPARWGQSRCWCSPCSVSPSTYRRESRVPGPASAPRASYSGRSPL